MNLSQENGLLRERLGFYFLLFLIAVLFCSFAVRLWYLQVYKGDYYFQKAQENLERRQHVHAPRGLVLDREGELLAINEPSYSLAVVREEIEELDQTLNQISKWTGKPREDIQEKFERGRGMVPSFENQILVSNLSYQVLTKVETEAPYWPGVEIVVQPRRKYPQGEVLSNVLGYVGKADKRALERDSDLRLGDNVGKQGLEYVKEKTLRGNKGLKKQEVDASGRVVREEVLVQPESGQDVQLSIDLELQDHVHSLLQGEAGAAVVMDADTGQVLAMVSTPGYDNNKFPVGVSREDWRNLLENPHNPLLNRSIQNAYPPGSVFKPVMAALALEEADIDPEEEINCTGRYRLGNRVFRCWHDHGDVDMHEALVQSCDTYFYRLGEKLGVDKISDFAVASGLGKQTGISLPQERSGVIPTREWKKDRVNEAWRGGDDLNLAIGQGFTQVTPLQMARFAGAVANGGYLYQPSLFLDDEKIGPEPLPWKEETKDFIYDAMVGAVEDDSGTARRLRIPEITVGGKTGTAQVVSLMPGHKEDELEAVDYWLRHHAWMISFAERKDRRYAVATLVEHGGSGSSAAGPVVKSIYEHLFEQDQAQR